MVMSGPIPAGSPNVSARGFAIASTIFDHRGFADFLQIRFRLRLVLLGHTSCRGFPSFSACRRWSACCRKARPSRRPVWSPRARSNGRSESCRAIREATAGMSAEVLVTASRIAAFCMDLNKALASSQVCTRLRSASASLRLASIADGGDPRGTIRTIGCILYSKPRLSACRLAAPERRRRPPFRRPAGSP